MNFMFRIPFCTRDKILCIATTIQFEGILLQSSYVAIHVFNSKLMMLLLTELYKEEQGFFYLSWVQL